MRGLKTPVVLCRRDPEGSPPLFGLIGVSPVSVHSLAVPGGHGIMEEAILASAKDQRSLWQSWLAS